MDLDEAVLRSFSTSYAEARTRFLDAARGAGAAIAHFACPAKGPAGEVLALDVAYIEGAGAELVVISSGVHGVEGYAGSAVQIDTLLRGWPADGPGLLLIHFVNPYGMAWTCSDNEDGVDLNRNFVDFSQPPRHNILYDEVESFVCCPDLDGEGRAAADAAMATYIEQEGFDHFIRAVADGQHHRPGGYLYGGHAPVWSNLTLRGILCDYTRRTRRVAIIDVHTGLGDRGAASMLCINAPAPAAERASRWWDNLVLVPSVDFPFAPVGTFVGSVWDFGLDAELTVAALEVGTEPVERAFGALRDRKWLEKFGDFDGPATAPILAEMHACLAPRDIAWRRAMLEAGRKAVDAAAAGIVHDASA
ncbi:M14 family metallopeptidase [Sphingomonas lycopersici]|uniref:M14 family metallopeptidase n=1 Tax=Sphingomonas lycopersici TaxID=2951807 RepID=A0AA41ZHU8_9SPHN|nr:M14 family metallopeptidase [Sphingomonas lycopersici]MCW6536936.1 M14 family metallopeptidase [Sphingomonas lycopersici]